MDNIQESLKTGKYNIAWLASQLYGEKSVINTAKLHNKIKNNQGKRLTNDEIKKLENILK